MKTFFLVCTPEFEEKICLCPTKYFFYLPPPATLLWRRGRNIVKAYYTRLLFCFYFWVLERNRKCSGCNEFVLQIKRSAEFKIRSGAHCWSFLRAVTRRVQFRVILLCFIVIRFPDSFTLLLCQLMDL